MQNSNFIHIIKYIRRIMPGLGVFMVLLVYIVSAFAGGAFLSGLVKSTLLGYAIAVAIQFTRGVIVFFSQMNPGRPTFGYAGEIAAVVFGLLSVYEMYSLTTGLYPSSVFVSLALLMIAGIVIEIMLLREVKYATEQEMVNNPGILQQLRQNAFSRAQLKIDLQAIEDAEASGSALPAYQQSTPAPSPKPRFFMPPAAPQKPKVDDGTLEALELNLNGNGHSGNGNGKH